jgi:hypothetical protein
MNQFKMRHLKVQLQPLPSYLLLFLAAPKADQYALFPSNFVLVITIKLNYLYILKRTYTTETR